jgi:excisionase family DNA binding protein
MATEAIMTTSEAARYLGVHIDTLRGWTRTGKIQCWRTAGGHRRFDVEALQRFRGEAPHDLRSVY